jgi:hypothetical protein
LNLLRRKRTRFQRLNQYDEREGISQLEVSSMSRGTKVLSGFVGTCEKLIHQMNCFVHVNLHPTRSVTYSWIIRCTPRMRKGHADNTQTMHLIEKCMILENARVFASGNALMGNPEAHLLK